MIFSRSEYFSIFYTTKKKSRENIYKYIYIYVSSLVGSSLFGNGSLLKQCIACSNLLCFFYSCLVFFRTRIRVEYTKEMTGNHTGPSVPEGQKRSYGDLVNRIIYSLIMIFGFLSFVSLGLVAGVIVVLFIQACMFTEISRIGRVEDQERSLPWNLPLKLYLFTVCTAISLVFGLEEPLKHSFPFLDGVYPLFVFTSFCCSIVAFISFVLSLTKGFYKYQLMRLVWTVMTLLVFETQFYFEMRNMLQGMIWFLLPVFCVVVNDSWAFICGKLFGRTTLLLLSPKKTVEGFIGAMIITVLWSYWFCGFLSHFPAMYCPATGFTSIVNSSCERDSLFETREFLLPGFIRTISGGRLSTTTSSEAQLHSLALGVFASVVAPFGGFFASGVKRSFNMKDFGNLIPGHGGMTDRMDCQGLMGLCTFFYLSSFVFRNQEALYESTLVKAMKLTSEQKIQLCHELRVCPL